MACDHALCVRSPVRVEQHRKSHVGGGAVGEQQRPSPGAARPRWWIVTLGSTSGVAASLREHGAAHAPPCAPARVSSEDGPQHGDAPADGGVVHRRCPW